jgi:magnesium transporter
MTDPRDDAPDERREDEYALDRDAVVAVAAALAEDDPTALRAAIADLHEADIADIIEQLDPDRRRRMVEALGADLTADILTELEEGVRDQVLAYLDPAVLAEAVKDLDTDDIVYLVEDLDAEDQAKVLESLDAEDRAVVEQSLTYPEYSAGRLMRREVVTAPPFWTVGQTIDWLRAAEELPEPFYDVIVVDPAMKPLGKVPLSRILAARRPMTLEGVMEDDFRTVRVDDSQEDVAYAFNKYHLVSAPVVDAGDRLVGVITIDDAMEVLSDEHEEDMLRLGGVGGDEEITDSVGETVKLRFPWLFVNLLTAVLASGVIALFEDVIAQVVALAVLMPIVASMGGNAGTQSLTVAVRALATRNLTDTNALRVIGREAAAGLINGLGFAAVMAVVALLWFGDPMIAAVIGAAMIVNMLAAALAGVLIPIALDKAGADPALASGTFVTTVTDVVGFFAFLGLASVALL